MKSPFDTYLRGACGTVVALNLVLGALPLFDHCMVVLGGLAWCVVGALYVVGVLVPAFIGRFVGPFGARNVAYLVAAAAATALAFVAMSLLGGDNLGHCIA